MKDTPRDEDDPAAWLDDHGDALYAYAVKRLHVAATAEDLVQDTLLAALQARDRFSGRSSVRTWLVGILKHKLVDRIRKDSRERPYEDAEAASQPPDGRFDDAGAWRAGVVSWIPDPRQVLENKEFMATLADCMSRLPAGLHRVFVLREMDGDTTEEICKELAVSTTNLWVMLHRARARLRDCLTAHWFEMRT